MSAEEELAAVGGSEGGGWSSTWYAVPQQWSNANIVSTTSDSFTYGSIESDRLGGVFQAPPSGYVWVSVLGWLGSNTIIQGRKFLMGYTIRTGDVIGSGTVVQAATEARAAVYFKPTTEPANRYNYVHIRIRSLALTPGDTYNVQVEQLSDVAGDTCLTYRRHLQIEGIAES